MIAIEIAPGTMMIAKIAASPQCTKKPNARKTTTSAITVATMVMLRDFALTGLRPSSVRGAGLATLVVLEVLGVAGPLEALGAVVEADVA